MQIKKYKKIRARIPSAIQREVKIEAGHSCLVCRERVSLVLHHLDGNRENNISENIVYICSNCHGMAHDGKISLMDFREYKRRAKQQNEELLKLKRELVHFLGVHNESVSSDFASLQLKYHEMLTEYADKLIFYQCFIYLIPEFYIDQRSDVMKSTIRDLLNITLDDEETIMRQLNLFEITETIGGLVFLKDKSDAKIALGELISSGKLDMKKLIEKFVLL